VLQAFHADVIRNFTGDILSKVHVIDYEGRHFLAHTDERFDVIDLSLADILNEVLEALPKGWDMIP